MWVSKIFFEKFQFDSYVRVFEKFALKAFEKGWCEKYFDFVLKRASIHESSTYPKEFVCVNVL